MPLDVKDAARLWDMLDAARAAATFIDELNFAQYVEDRKPEMPSSAIWKSLAKRDGISPITPVISSLRCLGLL